jgi:hypothetical protein
MANGEWRMANGEWRMANGETRSEIKTIGQKSATTPTRIVLQSENRSHPWATMAL